MNNKDFDEKIKDLGFNEKEKFEKEQVNELIEQLEKLRLSFNGR